MVHGLLEEHGIVARVTADDAGGMHPGLAAVGGAKVLVRKADFMRARALLAARPLPD